MKGLRTSIGIFGWIACGGLAFGHLSAPEAPSRPEQRFSAMLLVTDEPDEVLRAWRTGTPAPPVKPVETIPRGKSIVAFVLFTGCLPDRNLLCNVTADFTIRRPDGSVYAGFEAREVWQGKPAPPRGTLRLSAEYVGAVLEPQDPLGEYEFDVSVHDRNADMQVDLKQRFKAVE